MTLRGLALLLALYASPEVAHAQDTVECTLRRDNSRGPTAQDIYYKSATGDQAVAGQRIDQAIAGWNSCRASIPNLHHATATKPAPAGATVWTIQRGTYGDFSIPLLERNKCGDTPYGRPKVIRIFTDAPTRRCGTNGQYLHKILMHELGHTMAMHHTEARPEGHVWKANSDACRATRATMTHTPVNERVLVENVDCKFAHEFLRENHPVDCDETPNHEDCSDDDDDDGDDDPDSGGDPGGGGGTNPGGGANPNPDCTANPDDLRCKPDCTLNPKAPGCPEITFGPACFGNWDDKNGNGKIDEGECDLVALSGPPGSGGVTTTHTGVSSSRSYVLGLRAESAVTLSLTKMTRDFDCKGEPGNGLATDKDPPDAIQGASGSWRCSNRGGSADDSWSGTLPAGEHTITVWPYGGGKAGDYTLSVAIREKLIPRGLRALPFAVSENDVSGEQEYAFSLSSDTRVKVVVSDQSADIDCRIDSTSCRNHGGTADETWSGILKKGSHTVTVWPYRGSGNYKVTVTGSSTTTTPPTPPPPLPSTLACPNIPDFRLPSGGTVNTVLPEATGGTAPYTYGLSGQPPGISFLSSTRVASGTLPTVTTDTNYTVTYACTDNAAASASVTFLVSVLAPSSPAAPRLTGSVAGRTQTLTWSEAAGDGITRYQLQTRASSAHTWRFTGAGTPSPSSNIGPNVRSWSVLTPWTLYRQYKVRATNAAGDGAWSNVVELTTPAAPPPPPPPPSTLSLPGIPDFPGLPSRGVVNTPFPAATGGAPPYSYGLSGLPPGISFAPSTRVASGTLPTVRTATTYRITYVVTDSAGGTASVTFRATVVPP